MANQAEKKYALNSIKAVQIWEAEKGVIALINWHL
jgi:hypothetical protein